MMPIDTENNDYKPKYPVLTLEKALIIINFFKENASPEGLSLNDICQGLDMKKSGVHRILDTLYSFGYVNKMYCGNRYKLNWTLYNIGSVVPKFYNLSSKECMQIINAVCKKYNETFTISVLDGSHSVIMNIAEPNISLKSTGTVGEKRPLYATASGKIFLSQFTEKKIYDFYRVNKIEAFTKATITTPAKMIAEIEDIRAKGYAMDREEACEGLTCITMPIWDFSGNIVASISASGPTQRIMDKFDKGLRAELKETSLLLSQHMGYSS